MRSVVATFIFAATLALAAISLSLMATTWHVAIPDSWGFRGFTSIFAFAFGGAGLVILRRHPAHVVGWLLLVGGLISAIQLFGEEYGVASYYGGLDLPAASWAAWLNVWIWVIVVASVAIGVPLYFPDGRLPSPRWRPVAWLGVLATAITAISAVADPLQLRTNMRGVPAPYDHRVLGPLGDIAPTLFSTVGFGLISVLALAAGVSVVRRFRRARGAERQQIKWFAFAAAANAVAAVGNVLTQPFAMGQVGWEGKAAQYLFIGAMALIPITIGIAIRRYRLYDLDLVINRTLVYGMTSAMLGVGFVVIVVALQAPLRPFTGGSEIAIAASTMLTLAAFQPLRRRVQDAVDRRFYRSRYDSARTLDAFAMRLRDDVDLDRVRAELLSALGDTVRPTHAGVWLREAGK